MPLVPAPRHTGDDRHSRAGAERRHLRGFEVHDRLQVVDERLQLVVAGLVQVALRLQHEEVGGHPGLELLLFGFEALLGQGARRARGFDPLALVVTVRATSRTSVATRMREASSCLTVC